MNPLTNMKNVTKLSEQELHTSNKTSWHDQYADSAWIFIGGLPYDLTEGDIVCIFSQYGEIVNINLIRDKDNGKSKGFCFLCYEDQRSTVLAVDNLNGTKILNRILRVDHVSDYKIPKQGKKTDAETKKLYEEGCAPKPEVPKFLNPLREPQDVRETLADQIHADIKLPARLPIYPIKTEPLDEDSIKIEDDSETDAKKKEKKKKKSKAHLNNDCTSASESDGCKTRKKKKKSKRSSSSESDGFMQEENKKTKYKKEKYSRHKYDTDLEANKRSRSSDKHRKNDKYKSDYRNEKVKLKHNRRSRSRSSDKIYSAKKRERVEDCSRMNS